MTDAPAIFLLANDRVLANIVQLLHSLRVHGFTNKVFCIEFNEETYFLKRVCRAFGVESYDVCLERLDSLGRRIFDRDPPANPYPYCLGKLRKLSFLTFPGPAVYLDADCIVTAAAELFNQIFAVPAPHIGYINTSPDGVYEDVPAAAALRHRSTFMTSGMIAKSRAAIEIPEFERFFNDSMIEQFHSVRRRGGYVDQPLCNLLVDSDFFPALDLLADKRASRVTSVTGDLKLQPDGSASVGGLPVLLLHLAGPALKKSPRYRYLLDGMLLGGLRDIAGSDPDAFSEISRFYSPAEDAVFPMPRDPLEPKVLPKISVVICTFNRHDMLLEAIMSVELQDLPGQEYELIIVDNSDDLAARQRFRGGLQIACAHRYLEEARPGLSRARNIGIHAARAELVAFLDDDAKACASWLRHIIEAFSTNEAAGVVGGPVRPIWAARCPDWLTPRLHSFLTIIDRGDEARLLAAEEWLSGTNIAFRTRAVTEAGLFPENLGRIRGLLLSNEELLVTQRIRDLGYTVFYDPKIEMHHRVHPDRVSQSWLRRRVFWQVLSDLFIDDQLQPCRGQDDIRRILDFLMKLAPRHRGAMGLFLDTDDAQLFEAQTEAISALARLLATDCGDWRSVLAEGQQ